MFSIKEAAKYLNVSPRTIRNLIDAGQLSHHRIGVGRGVIRISAEALQEHLAACEVDKRRQRNPRKRQRQPLRHLKL